MPPSVAHAPSAPEPPPAPEPPAPAPLEAAPAPAARETIEVTLVVTPADATITLDGAPSAAHVVLPRDGAEHTFVVSAEGHEPRTWTTTADRDREVVLELDRAAVPRGRAAAPRARPAAPSPAPATAAPSPSERPRHIVGEF
jgi:hypothetical protein